MSLNTNALVSNMYANKTGETERSNTSQQTKKAETYGKTIGDPQLSDKAQKYYEQLKKKYGNYDFILVSKEEKANAQANAGKYANNIKTVVLIDEEKIERMANDEAFRKKYEGILSGAASQLQQLKGSMETSGVNVKGYGMQVNDNGTTSFFAVLKKSAADQKTRIEKTAEKKKAEKKEASRKAAKKEKEERIKKSGGEKLNAIEDSDDEETVTITANSIEELISKLKDYDLEERSNNARTESEKMLGQHIDFRG